MSWPAPCRISRVRNAVTGKPSASGESSGPQPVITPASASLSSRAWTVPRATPSRRDASSTPIRGSCVNRSISLPSSASIPASQSEQVVQCFAY